jgi:uncharacterized glyoxalase superfamily protein PhnB
MSLDAIGIVSRDTKKTSAFYQILGLSFQEAGSADHLEATTPSGVRIMVDSMELMKKINPQYKPSSGSGIVLCFKQESPSQVNELFNKVVELGFEGIKEPWDAFWGQRYASVLDPDGNQIDLFAALQG